ncbi:MAG: hypothetical protein AB4041_18945 [Microcystaceae cyanobacterium]
MKLAEILENLQKPVPSQLISQKPVFKKKVKQKDVDFISWYDLCDLLDQRCGLDGWEWSQSVTQVGNRVIVEGKLSIIGEDRQISKSSQGNEEIEAVVMYGDCVSNSEAMALRRCCAKFGVARDLWRKADKQKQPSLPNIPNKPTKKANNVVSLDPNSPAAWYEKGKKDGLNDEQPKYPKVKPYMEGYEAHCPPEKHPEYDPTIYDKTMGV